MTNFTFYDALKTILVQNAEARLVFTDLPWCPSDQLTSKCNLRCYVSPSKPFTVQLQSICRPISAYPAKPWLACIRSQAVSSDGTQEVCLQCHCDRPMQQHLLEKTLKIHSPPSPRLWVRTAHLQVSCLWCGMCFYGFLFTFYVFNLFR